MKNKYIERKLSEIKSLLQEWYEDDSTDIYLEMYFGEENKKFANMKGMDIRLFESGYCENALTLRSLTKEGGEILGHFTIYMVPKEVYGNEFVWIMDKRENVLKKVYLRKWEEQIGDLLLITGYSNTRNADKKFQTNYYKWINTTRCIQVLKVMGESIPIYEEPMGLYRCSEEQLAMNELKESSLGSFEDLGKVNESSMASFRFANMLKLQRIPEAYHNITLGPVFCGFLDEKRNIKF